MNFLTRESACKASFNYLLLDPRLSQNIPMHLYTSCDQDLWKTFISSIFYVGKGTRSRPFHHLYEAAKIFQNKDRKAKKERSKKIEQILSVWNANHGVVVLPIFHNTIAVEAFTREAAMIDAIGCGNLTNIKGGDYYGPAADWSINDKLLLGTFLIFKAFKIFLQDGERQIRPVDLRL